MKLLEISNNGRGIVNRHNALVFRLLKQLKSKGKRINYIGPFLEGDNNVKKIFGEVAIVNDDGIQVYADRRFYVIGFTTINKTVLDLEEVKTQDGRSYYILRAEIEDEDQRAAD